MIEKTQFEIMNENLQTLLDSVEYTFVKLTVNFDSEKEENTKLEFWYNESLSHKFDPKMTQEFKYCYASIFTRLLVSTRQIITETSRTIQSGIIIYYTLRPKIQKFPN